MAMRCSPNSGAGSRTIVIKLLVNYGPVSGFFCSQNCSSEAGCIGWKNTGLSMEILWSMLDMDDMLNCVYCFGSEHEDPALCVVA